MKNRFTMQEVLSGIMYFALLGAGFYLIINGFEQINPAYADIAGGSLILYLLNRMSQ